MMARKHRMLTGVVHFDGALRGVRNVEDPITVGHLAFPRSMVLLASQGKDAPGNLPHRLMPQMVIAGQDVL